MKLIGMLPVALLVALPLAACSSDKPTSDGGKPTSTSALDYPEPKPAMFLHEGYRVTTKLKARLRGDDLPTDVILVSSGPGSNPQKPVKGGTQDVQVLSWDPADKKWRARFDAADPIQTGASDTGFSEKAPLLDQGSPLVDVWAAAVGFSPGHQQLVIYARDGQGNHPAARVAIVTLAPSKAPRVAYYDEETALTKPFVRGTRGSQLLVVSGSLYTFSDEACCPVRTYTQTIGPDPKSSDKLAPLVVLSDDRPWLGVDIAHDPDGTGSVVVNVTDGSPAEGVLQIADRLLSVAGSPTTGKPSVADQIALHQPNDEVTLVVTRAGRQLQLPARLGTLKDATQREHGAVLDPAVLGVGVKPAPGADGVVITVVDEGSPAAKAKLVKGDVMTTLDGVHLQNQTDLGAALAGKASLDVRITVKHANGRTETVTATPGTPTETGAAPFANPV